MTQFDMLQVCYFFFFNLLFFINEDRNTVSAPPLQTVLIEEVAYVKKIIVTGGTHTRTHRSQISKPLMFHSKMSVLIVWFGHIQNSLNDEITDRVIYFT